MPTTQCVHAHYAMRACPLRYACMPTTLCVHTHYAMRAWHAHAMSVCPNGKRKLSCQALNTTPGRLHGSTVIQISRVCARTTRLGTSKGENTSAPTRQIFPMQGNSSSPPMGTAGAGCCGVVRRLLYLLPPNVPVEEDVHRNCCRSITH